MKFKYLTFDNKEKKVNISCDCGCDTLIKKINYDDPISQFSFKKSFQCEECGQWFEIPGLWVEEI